MRLDETLKVHHNLSIVMGHKIAKIFLINLGALFLMCVPARAQFAFVEPYVGIGQVQIAIYNSQYNDHDEKDVASGFSLGMKAGYQYKRVFIGGDYQTGGPYVFGRPGLKGEWTLRALGAGLGLDYEISRFWIGYYFDTTIDDSKNRFKYTGEAYKIGFGLEVAKNVHANLDVMLVNILKATAASTTGTQPASQHPKVTTIFASISLPIELK